VNRTINIGLVGWGTIGTGVSKILTGKIDLIEKKAGVKLKLCKIADLDITTPRKGISFDESILTTDADEIFNDPEIDIVVQLIGGTSAARTLMLKAINSNKNVVTANKALLAKYGSEIFQAAYENKVGLKFEASVGGGIPIIKSLHEGFAANQIRSIYGIVNGTTNYILTEMSRYGINFDEGLKDAQKHGYAEADPSHDVEGNDAAHKITILTSLAYGINMNLESVYVEGITKIDSRDIQYARELGYVIKLLAISKLSEGKIEVRVHPTLIPENSMLASVNGVFNAIYVVGDAVGATMFYGQGAGEMPTAGAIIADIIDLAKWIIYNSPKSIPYCWNPNLKDEIPIRPIEQCELRYYVRHMAVDQPGVLANISGIYGKHQISIESVIQKGRRINGIVPIVLMTHEAIEENMQKAIKEIDNLNVVNGNSMLIRVESGE